MRYTYQLIISGILSGLFTLMPFLLNPQIGVFGFMVGTAAGVIFAKFYFVPKQMQMMEKMGLFKRKISYRDILKIKNTFNFRRSPWYILMITVLFLLGYRASLRVPQALGIFLGEVCFSFVTALVFCICLAILKKEKEIGRKIESPMSVLAKWEHARS